MASDSPPNRDAIGFIGLGAIGSPIALRLIEAGFNLVVHDVRSEAMRPFTGRAQLASSGTEVGERSSAPEQAARR